MKVSIIVPVYNVEKFLGKCIDSLVNQTLDDIEVILVNDGSPDNSQTIIDEYKKKYPKKIKSFIKENGGQGSARNYGLTQATGEYIMYVDSDDFVDRDMAKRMYEKAKLDDSDIVVCGSTVVDEDYNVIKKESAYSYEDKNDISTNFLFGNMAVWNKIYKKTLLVNNNIEFRSKVWYEDVDFTMKTFFCAKKVSFIDEPFYFYLLRSGSTMNNNNIVRNLELCLSFDEIIDYCQKRQILDLHKEKIEFLCVYHMYICGITRVINTQNSRKEKKEVIDKFVDYTKSHFASFKKNSLLKKLDRNKRIVFNLINMRLYGLIELIFRVKGKRA